MTNTAFTTIYLVVAQAMDAVIARLVRLSGTRGERGQASAEYALVLLGAALLAILLGSWLKQNDTVKKIFGDVIAKILGDMP